jgi:hypothetical protein
MDASAVVVVFNFTILEGAELTLGENFLETVIKISIYFPFENSGHFSTNGVDASR